MGAVGSSDVHRVRLREVIPVSVRIARTNEQEVLRPVHGEGKQRRLHRTAMISVPPPFRLYALVVTSVLILIVLRPGCLTQTAMSQPSATRP